MNAWAEFWKRCAVKTYDLSGAELTEPEDILGVLPELTCGDPDCGMTPCMEVRQAIAEIERLRAVIEHDRVLLEAQIVVIDQLMALAKSRSTTVDPS